MRPGDTYHLDLTTPCVLAEHVNSLGRATRNEEKYRVHWEREFGPIPDGLDLDHECHNQDPVCAGGNTCRHRACYNFKHIILDTRANNLARGQTFATKNRIVRTPKVQAYLTQPEVKEQFVADGTVNAALGYSKPGARDLIECEYCGKICKGTRGLGNHLTTGHGIDRSVQCDLCGRWSKTPYRLQRHQEHCRKVRRDV